MAIYQPSVEHGRDMLGAASRALALSYSAFIVAPVLLMVWLASSGSRGAAGFMGGVAVTLAAVALLAFWQGRSRFAAHARRYTQPIRVHLERGSLRTETQYGVSLLKREGIARVREYAHSFVVEHVAGMSTPIPRASLAAEEVSILRSWLGDREDGGPGNADTLLRLTSAAPTFVVSDVGATAAWYASELGFQSSFFPEREPYVHASLSRDGVELMLLLIEGYEKPKLTRPEGLWDAYIRMEGVPSLYERVREKPFLHMPLKKQSYGDWEFEIRDPNGYVLVFSELVE